MTLQEVRIEAILGRLKNDGAFITLSLVPSPKNKPGNWLVIDGGMYGQFRDVSPRFYDRMVDEYDSRK